MTNDHTNAVPMVPASLPAFRVGLSAIYIPDRAYTTMADCLRAGAIGQSGYVERFEQGVAEMVGARYCVAVCNGTMADVVALAAMREQYRFKRVVLPALTFIAQANAVRLAGMQADFVDVQEDWTIDIDRAVERCGAEGLLFLTHTMGRVAGVDRIAGDRLYIEDACEAFGSRLDGKWAGTFGEMGTYSFFVSHTLTTGEGGAVVTDDPDLAGLARQLRSHGRASEREAQRKFSFPLVGYNAKMSGLTAALGVALLPDAEQLIYQRTRTFAEMDELLGGRFPTRAGERVVPHGYPVGFESETARDRAMHNLLSEGVECRKFFSVLPTEGAWKGYLPKEFPVAEHISRTHLYVPCHQNMSSGDVHWVTEHILDQTGLSVGKGISGDENATMDPMFRKAE